VIFFTAKFVSVIEKGGVALVTVALVRRRFPVPLRLCMACSPLPTETEPKSTVNEPTLHFALANELLRRSVPYKPRSKQAMVEAGKPPCELAQCTVCTYANGRYSLSICFQRGREPWPQATRPSYLAPHFCLTSCLTLGYLALLRDLVFGGDYMNQSGLRVSLIGIIAASLLCATSAFALPLSFSGVGSGTEPGPPGVCNSATNGCPGSPTFCQCYQFSGTGKGTIIGKAIFSAQLILLTTALVGTELCFGANGTLTLTQKANAGNVLVLDLTGLDCINSSSTNVVSTDIVLNAAYNVNGKNSLGKFAGATGSGTLIGSIPVDPMNNNVLGNLNGTLQFAQPQ
jgi:hypothetical protein